MSVVLLKSSTAPENDNYVKELAAASLPSVVINTLRFNFHPEVLENIHFENYIGIVFTSARAVEAFRTVLSGERVTSRRCFCVGIATADKARLLGFRPEGYEAGNSENLASYIITSTSLEPSRQLLFPCGADRLDTIERRLKEAGFAVDVRIVYSAEKDPGLEAALRTALENRPRAIAFFSPSAVRHSSVVMKETDFIEKKVVSIGRSTSEALRAEGLQHIIEMSKPTPSDLVDAVCRL